MDDPVQPPRPPAPPGQPAAPTQPLRRPAEPVAREPYVPPADPYGVPPDPYGPRDPRWWESEWGALLAGLLGLLAGGLIGWIIGHNGHNNRTVTERGAGAPSTVTHTTVRTVRTPPKVVVRTHTVTVTTPSGGAEPGGGSTGGTQSFNGSGNRTLGTITVSRPSELRWTSEGSSFKFVSGEEEMVNSHSHSGSASIEPGSYPQSEVVSSGSWTLKIVPR